MGIWHSVLRVLAKPTGDNSCLLPTTYRFLYSAPLLTNTLGVPLKRKKGPRTAGEMVSALDIVYAALIADGWVDWLPNVVAASDLLQ